MCRSWYACGTASLPGESASCCTAGRGGRNALGQLGAPRCACSASATPTTSPRIPYACFLCRFSPSAHCQFCFPDSHNVPACLPTPAHLPLAHRQARLPPLPVCLPTFLPDLHLPAFRLSAVPRPACFAGPTAPWVGPQKPPTRGGSRWWQRLAGTPLCGLGSPTSQSPTLMAQKMQRCGQP